MVCFSLLFIKKNNSYFHTIITGHMDCGMQWFPVVSILLVLLRIILQRYSQLCVFTALARIAIVCLFELIVNHVAVDFVNLAYL